ncbi:hypothetical protein GCM10027422_16060 [Hymenobacter arcticus]
MSFRSEQVGDGIVQKLEVNFNAKQTTIYLERWSGEEVEQITVLFIGVELQDFKEFGDFNLLHDIEEAADPVEFWRWYSEWLERRRNYISTGVLENIAADASLRYFSIEAGYGFDGFVICKDLLISTHLQHS